MRRTTIAAIPVLALAAALIAGPLDPPAGPVAPTYKTLTEVEPRIAINAANTPGDADSIFKITQPGSYYLTGSITGVSGKRGIEIAAGGVTVDLNGFDLVGPGIAGVGATVSNLNNIAVRNGSIRGWGVGVDLYNSSATNCQVSNVQASINQFHGIGVGNSSTVVNCTATNNAGFGIKTLNVGVVTACVSSNNGGGIVTGTSATISGCTTDGNVTTGIETGDGSSVAGCISSNNATEGVRLTTGSTISQCTISRNQSDGIRVSTGCVVTGNSCSYNGDGLGTGAGIYVTGSDNRIEGNTCTFADQGIHVIGVSNILLRNTCATNTVNWTIVANNSLAPIVAAGTNAALISGNSATGTLGTIDSNANITY